MFCLSRATSATAEHLAASTTFLLSDDGVNINGVILPSDGGWSIQQFHLESTSEPDRQAATSDEEDASSTERVALGLRTRSPSGVGVTPTT